MGFKIHYPLCLLLWINQLICMEADEKESKRVSVELIFNDNQKRICSRDLVSCILTISDLLVDFDFNEKERFAIQLQIPSTAWDLMEPYLAYINKIKRTNDTAKKDKLEYQLYLDLRNRYLFPSESNLSKLGAIANIALYLNIPLLITVATRLIVALCKTSDEIRALLQKNDNPFMLKDDLLASVKKSILTDIPVYYAAPEIRWKTHREWQQCTFDRIAERLALAQQPLFAHRNMHIDILDISSRLSEPVLYAVLNTGLQSSIDNDDGVELIKFDFENTLLGATCAPNFLKLWQLPQKKAQEQLLPFYTFNKVYCGTFALQKSILALVKSTYPYLTQLFRIEGSETPIEVSAVDDWLPAALEISPNGRYLAMALDRIAQRQSLRIFDLSVPHALSEVSPDRLCLHSPNKKRNIYAQVLAFDQASRFLAAGDNKGNVGVFSVSDNMRKIGSVNAADVYDPYEYAVRVRGLRFNHDGNLLLIERERGIQLFDIRKWDTPCQLLRFESQDYERDRWHTAAFTPMDTIISTWTKAQKKPKALLPTTALYEIKSTKQTLSDEISPYITNYQVACLYAWALEKGDKKTASAVKKIKNALAAPEHKLVIDLLAQKKKIQGNFPETH